MAEEYPLDPLGSNADGGGWSDGGGVEHTAARAEEESPLSAEEAVAMLQKKGSGDDDKLGSSSIGIDGDVDRDDNDDDLSAKLTTNTYSILYVADPKSPAFIFGIVFFLFQVSLASLALVDLLDASSQNNVMKIPAGIPTYVRVAGYLSVVLAVPLFTDLLDSVERIHEGYDTVVLKQAPHATKCKFFMAYSLQFASGALFQTVIFLLIVQSTTVISMLLNFAALQFITEVDDVAFSLAARGYFNQSIKKTCQEVQELRTPNTKGPWLRRIFFGFIVMVVLVAYTSVFIQQEQGSYLCNRIEVQFGDEALSELPLYSGAYYVDKDKRENDRYVYIDEVSGQQIFRYCRSEGAWVFGYFGNDMSDDPDDLYDAICDDNSWLSKSPETRSFSILDVKASDWLVTTNEQNALVDPVEHFVIQCLDCTDTTCNELGGTCQNDFTLTDDAQVCACNEGFFGSECQFDISTTVCDSITFDHRFEPFEAAGFAFGTRYDLVVDENGDFMGFFDKTVYAHVYPESDTALFGLMEVIAFYGRRYYLTTVNWKADFPNATVDTAAQIYVKQLQLNRQGGFAFTDNPDFVSDPLNLASARNQITPTNLDWYLTATDVAGLPLGIGPSVSTRLVCEQCDDTVNSCHYGVCIKDNESDGFGTCDCGKGFIGSLCELFDPDTFNATQRS